VLKQQGVTLPSGLKYILAKGALQMHFLDGYLNNDLNIDLMMSFLMQIIIVKIAVLFKYNHKYYNN